MIQKFNSKHLARFCKTDCKVVLYEEGLSENGGPSKALEFQNKCRFVEKTRVIISTDGKQVNLVGEAVFVGDIAPNVTKISNGTCQIGEAKYNIYGARRPRNPDGSVHHTTLELM